MSLLKNQLIEWNLHENKAVIIRILWMNSLGDIVTIALNDKALPLWQKREEVEAALAQKQAYTLVKDPYTSLLCPDSEFLRKHGARRDEAWEIIAPIIESELAFIPQERGKLIASVQKHRRVSKPTIYKLLRRFWQGGQTKNALLPLYENCGGKDKERTVSELKRGRPNKLTKVTGCAIGININADIRKDLQKGYELFYKSSQRRPLTDAFQLTLEKFFNNGYELKNGIFFPIMRPAEEQPTLGQFKYWNENDSDISETIATREGRRRFLLRHRAVLGDSTQMAFGPGSIWQIDATIGDIYLVSSLDRSRIIGRPVIYIVKDVFSRLITGFYVGLEGPSWVGMMMALENATADKVAFCKTYGIEITEAEWPCHHLCDSLLGDRGELISSHADQLAGALNIRVDNTPPYRPDWKAIVERSFRISNDKLIHWLPGAVYKPRERGEKDYRLDAVLDLDQFRQLMIHIAINYNNHHYLNEYPLDEYMISDHVESYPVDLWRWGIENRVGHLRTMAPDIIRLNLLPSAEASVTEYGIYYDRLHYTCELATREQWFVKARRSGRWKIHIAYDPRRVNNIYLRIKGGKALEICELLPRSKMFQGCTWHEVHDYYALKQQSKQSSLTRGRQATANLHAQTEQILATATKETEASRVGLSKNSQVKGIRENRTTHCNERRQNEAWQVGEINTQLQDPNLSRPTEILTENDYVPPPQETEMLSELLEEIWKDG